MPTTQDNQKTLVALLKEQMMLETVRNTLEGKIKALRAAGEVRKASEARATIKRLTEKS